MMYSIKSADINTFFEVIYKSNNIYNSCCFVTCSDGKTTFSYHYKEKYIIIIDGEIILNFNKFKHILNVVVNSTDISYIVKNNIAQYIIFKNDEFEIKYILDTTIKTFDKNHIDETIKDCIKMNKLLDDNRKLKLDKIV